MLEKKDEIVWIVSCILRNKVIISRDEVECCILDVDDVGHLETTTSVKLGGQRHCNFLNFLHIK